MAIGISDPVAQRARSVPLDGGSPEIALPAPNPRARDDHNTLKLLEQWFLEQVEGHAENRREQLIDADFYDHEQWDEASKAALHERNQAPLVFNLIHPTIDWIIGTERRTRVDWKVHPRAPNDEDLADAKTKTLKFVGDVNEAGFERSTAFASAAKVGVGWVREFAQTDGDPLPVGVVSVPWQMVRYDPYSRRNDLTDCRSITIERYLDTDWAMSMFPHVAEELRSRTVVSIDPAIELIEDDLTIPGVFWGSRQRIGRMSGSLRGVNMGRSRVQMIETEYRKIRLSRRLRALSNEYADLHGDEYDATDGEINDLIRRKVLALDDKPVDEMWHAIWTPGCLCQNEPMDYRHQRFSLTPIWCYRRDRDGMPYGIVRGLRDPQEEYNKRRSKALFALSVNRVIYEDGAIAEDDEDEVLEQASKPNAQIRLAAGALSGKKFQIDTVADIATGHIALMEQSRQHINEGSGVTRENLGIESGAQSGRAIIAKQQQGAVTTAEIFDNYRRAIQQSGRKLLKLTEQFLTIPMQVRVSGVNGTEWVAINQPRFDPETGEVVFDNDMTASEADFVVDQQDYRETVRMAMAESLFETIRNLPPELQLQMLDLAIDLTDIPNRAEFVKRIREVNGQSRKGQPQSPEEAAAAQQQQADAEMQRVAASAKVEKDRAQARKYNADADNTSVRTKGDALNVAGILQHALPLAPAADRLVPLPRPPGA